jgi:hypothetical protein
MNNWFANIVDDVDNLYVEIDNLNEPSVGFFVLVTRFKQTRNAKPLPREHDKEQNDAQTH